MSLWKTSKPTSGENYELDELWEKEEYRSYVEQRRIHCSSMELMDLWLRVPYCSECFFSDPFERDRLPEITPDTWEDDIVWEIGQSTLERIKIELEENLDFAFLCKKCSRELRPWKYDEVYIVTYHFEEHCGIPLETSGCKNPSKRQKIHILHLYDNRCFRCGSKETLHIDHIFPQSKGGDAAFRNLQPLCEKCGNIKGNELPEEVKVSSDIYFAPILQMDMKVFSGS